MFRTHGEPELEKKGKKDRRIEAEGHVGWCAVRGNTTEFVRKL